MLPSLRFTCFVRLLFCLCITCLAQAQTFTVIHTFTGRDGKYPGGPLVVDSGGHLYGAAGAGGRGDGGAVFKLTPHGESWTFATLFAFDTASSGDNPGPVVFGPDGALYGTTGTGGSGLDGVVFKLQPPAAVCESTACAWKQTILAAFSRIQGTPSIPSGPLSFDADGNIYGTTEEGGNYSYPDECPGYGGCGMVYRLLKASNWAVDTLYQFNGTTDGEDPRSGVILDQAGNVYGTVLNDFFLGIGGNVFTLAPSGSGWNFHVLFQFQCHTTGCQLFGGLIFDRQGNLYGATSYGGPGDGGTAFQLSPANGGWNFNLLSSFTGPPGPASTLIMDHAGNLYGTVDYVGAHGCGSVFKLTNSNGNYTYTSLYDFNCGDDGKNPVDGLVMDSSGNLYGTTENGGSAGVGVVFEITP